MCSSSSSNTAGRGVPPSSFKISSSSSRFPSKPGSSRNLERKAHTILSWFSSGAKMKSHFSIKVKMTPRGAAEPHRPASRTQAQVLSAACISRSQPRESASSLMLLAVAALTMMVRTRPDSSKV